MNWFRIATGEDEDYSDQTWLFEEAKKYNDLRTFYSKVIPLDFGQQRQAARMLVTEIRSCGLGYKMNLDGTVTFWHGTSKQNAENILRTKILKDFSFGSPTKVKSGFGSEGATSYARGGGRVLNLKVDARDIHFNSGTGELEAPDGLVMDGGGTWRSPKRFSLQEIWEKVWKNKI